MGKYDGVMGHRPGPREAAAAAVSAVQASFYARLRPSKGASGAGQIGWMLIRASQEGHPDQLEASSALIAMSDADRSELIAVSRAALSAARSPEWTAIASAVLDHLEAIAGARRAVVSMAPRPSQTSPASRPSQTPAASSSSEAGEAKKRRRAMVDTLVALGWPDNAWGTATQDEVRTYREADRIIALLDSGIDASPAPWAGEAIAGGDETT